MITIEQAKQLQYRDELHFRTCTRIVGPHGGIKTHQTRVRVNGKVKTWKTRPNDFRVPIKYGLYECSYIDQNNADQFHLAEECPLNEKPEFPFGEFQDGKQWSDESYYERIEK